MGTDHIIIAKSVHSTLFNPLRGQDSLQVSRGGQIRCRYREGSGSLFVHRVAIGGAFVIMRTLCRGGSIDTCF
jgi:hypothetical protein